MTLHVLYVLIDWRSITPEKRTKVVRKVVNNRIKEKLYEELKSSVANETRNARSLPDDFSYATYVKTTSITDSEKKLKEVMDVISNNNRRKNEYYAILGIELANLKFLNIYDKCQLCVTETNMYKVLDCRTCNSKRNCMKYYYADVERITGFGKSYVNFLISVSKLCQEYPKLMFVTISITK